VAIIVEVSVGGGRIYADGVGMGAEDEGVPTVGPHHSPAPGEVTYLCSTEGCPDDAPG
jgi:hypothetical protein